MEYETEVHITEDFSKWSEQDKADLIEAIRAGEIWEFTGKDYIEVDGSDLRNEAYD